MILHVMDPVVSAEMRGNRGDPMSSELLKASHYFPFETSSLLNGHEITFRQAAVNASFVGSRRPSPVLVGS